MTFNDRDPTWMTSNIKDKINYRNNSYREYMKKGKRPVDYMKLQNTIKELSEMTSTRKNDYKLHLANKLIDLRTSSKTYWHILKIFYNGRKTPIIPPLLINGKSETDFKKKAHHFNTFFASKCTPLINHSILPDSIDYMSTVKLSSINFNNVDILKIIKSLNVNKAHGHDDISIRMIKLCGQPIVKPLSIIFKNCIGYGIFPDIWKKSNIIPVHKKDDKQITDYYRPASLLPNCGKIFEKLLFNSIFKFLDDNNLLF